MVEKGQAADEIPRVAMELRGQWLWTVVTGWIHRITQLASKKGHKKAAPGTTGTPIYVYLAGHAVDYILWGSRSYVLAHPAQQWCLSMMRHTKINM